MSHVHRDVVPHGAEQAPEQADEAVGLLLGV